MFCIDQDESQVKIRKDKTSGYIMTSTAWAELGGQEVNHVALVKLSSSPAL